MAEVVLGVGGGIAAYKACELLRLLAEAGHHVTVVPTAAALRFVGAPTWEALSGNPVAEDVWTQAHRVPHVRIGRSAELVVVAPATADLLARAATGLADDLLTNTLLTAACPVLYAPAMHTEMWEHPATADNVATLRRRGAVVVEPAVGRLTGADSGRGRLPEPAELFRLATRLLARGATAPDLSARHMVVTAGGTREPLDPVRFLGNRSSGKQGHAFARAALARGAGVTLVSANVTEPPPPGVELVRVETTAELRDAALAAAPTADAVVMAAAPCDFTPARYAAQKLSKESGGSTAPGLTLELVATADIAAALGAVKPPGQVLVAFAAETVTGEPARASARRKLARKQADLIVLNQVASEAGASTVFGADENAATVFGADGSTTELPSRSKDELADAVWDLVKPLLKPA